MDGIENATVTGVDELAALYAQPLERVLKKEIDHVDTMGRAFIAASPFLVLATGSSKGLDCSPKGDKPGFVQVADDGRTLLIPDRRGNNRIDSIKNLVEDPRVSRHWETSPPPAHPVPIPPPTTPTWSAACRTSSTDRRDRAPRRVSA